MSKEELETEAEEKYVEVDREFIACQDEGEVFNIGYVMGAEPREKQIQALEERCLQLQKDKGGLNDELIRAKELLKWALHSDPEHNEDFEKKWEEAEQFLKNNA